MASIEFTAFARTTEGRGASRRMRRQGKTPGIVYGGTGEPAPIELDHNALIHALRNEAFHSSDSDDEAERRRDEGVAARFANASVSP
jgi:large subunit ribosomal protein L25